MYGLLKLTLAKILPNWVEKAIVLDTDVIFATDISKLWNIFRQVKFVLYNGEGRLVGTAVFRIRIRINICLLDPDPDPGGKTS